MSPPVRVAATVLAIVLLAICARQVVPAAAVRAGDSRDDGGATYRVDSATADRAGVPVLDAATRTATVRFAPEAGAQAQSYFLGAVAGAEPAAQRLIGLVDGLVTVRFGALPGNTIGLTRFDGRTRYDVTIDIERLLRDHGVQALNATVLHELGHVIDRAIVSDALIAELDAKIPTSINCIADRSAAGCPPVEERFADTFARWAMNDISINGTVGYHILPPLQVAEWGLPLARLGV